MVQEETKLDPETQKFQAELDAKLGKLIYSKGNLPPHEVTSALHALDSVRVRLEPKYAFQVTMAHTEGLEDKLKSATNVRTQPTTEGFQHVFSVLPEQARQYGVKGIFFLVLAGDAKHGNRIGVNPNMVTGVGTELPLDKLRGIKIIPRPK